MRTHPSTGIEPVQPAQRTTLGFLTVLILALAGIAAVVSPGLAVVVLFVPVAIGIGHALQRYQRETPRHHAAS